MVRRMLLIIRSPPYGSIRVSEGIRVATAMIAMDVLPQMLFIDDGVYCLVKNQMPEATGLPSFGERLKTLADLVGLHAVSDAVVSRNLRSSDFEETYKVKTISLEEAADLIMKNDVVLTF